MSAGALFNVKVGLRVDGARARLNAAKRGLGDRATVSALNKTAAQAKTQMSRLIREDYNVSASLVRERLQVRRAMKQGEFAFEAALLGNANNQPRAMNLIHFLERKTTLAEARRRRKAGTGSELHFRIKRRGGKSVIPGAFVGNRGRTVFIREGRARLPIRPVQTIAVPQMFNTKKNRGAVERFIREAFPRIYQREMAYFTSTLKR
ncbi:MAG: phage tail protein [Burkholderiales bacterium]|nr:phage tail protein [Burkholderiales bacterium]